MPIFQQHANASQRANSQADGSPGKGMTTNYGERLYHRGLKRREDREVRLRNARSEQLRAEIDGLTFQPQTNVAKNRNADSN